jgi:hypothetical protein
MTSPLDAAIEHLTKIGEDEKEDLLLREDARQLASDLSSFTTYRMTIKRLGRNARAAVRHRQYRIDALRYNTVLHLRAVAPTHLCLTEAFETAGAALNCSGESVRKSYYKAKKRSSAQ